MKQKHLKILTGLTLGILLFVIAVSVSAQPITPIENPAEGKLVNISFDNLIKRVINWGLYAAGSIAVIFLLVGGFQYIASRGNEEQMERAKKTITAAIIGIVIIVMAFAIVSIVNNILSSDPGTASTSGVEATVLEPNLNPISYSGSGLGNCPLSSFCDIPIGGVSGGEPPYALVSASGVPAGLYAATTNDGNVFITGITDQGGSTDVSIVVRDSSNPPQNVTIPVSLHVL